jgi:hypothetical protein
MKFRELLGYIFANFCSSKLENLEAMDFYIQFTKIKPRGNKQLKQRSVTNNKVEAELKCLPTKKSLGPDRFIAEFYHTLKKK